MRNELPDEVKLAAGDQLLTKGEVAKTLRSLRQRVVDLCRSGHLSFVTVGTHRRIRRRHPEAARNRTVRMTRDLRRSPEAFHAVTTGTAAR